MTVNSNAETLAISGNPIFGFPYEIIKGGQRNELKKIVAQKLSVHLKTGYIISEKFPSKEAWDIEDWEEHFDSVKIREPLTIVNTSGELIVIPYENISHIKFSYIYDTE